LVFRGAQDQTITSSERATIDAAKATDDMRRAAPEYRWHVDTAIDRDICPHTRSARAKPQDSAALHALWSIDRCVFIVDGGLEIRPCHCYHRRLVESQFRTEQRCFQGCRVRRVSNQRVCTTLRLAIHRPGNGDSAILITPSAAILDRGEKAGPHYCDEAVGIRDRGLGINCPLVLDP
jgi:hypothetical protein